MEEFVVVGEKVTRNGRKTDIKASCKFWLTVSICTLERNYSPLYVLNQCRHYLDSLGIFFYNAIEDYLLREMLRKSELGMYLQ